jgi:hypothetical protein
MPAQRGLVFRKAADVLLDGGDLPRSLAQKDFGVDQVEESLRVLAEAGVLFEVSLDAKALAALPVILKVGAEQCPPLAGTGG